MSGAFVGHDVFTCRMCSMTHICFCDMNTGLLHGHVSCNHIRKCAVTHLCMCDMTHSRACHNIHAPLQNEPDTQTHTRTHAHTHTHTRTHTRSLLSHKYIQMHHYRTNAQAAGTTAAGSRRTDLYQPAYWQPWGALARTNSPTFLQKSLSSQQKTPVLYSIKRETYKHVTRSALARTNSPAFLQKSPTFQQKRTVFQQ